MLLNLTGSEPRCKARNSLTSEWWQFTVQTVQAVHGEGSARSCNCSAYAPSSVMTDGRMVAGVRSHLVKCC